MIKYVVYIVIFGITCFVYVSVCRLLGFDNIEGFCPVIGIFVTMTYTNRVMEWLKR